MCTLKHDVYSFSIASYFKVKLEIQPSSHIPRVSTTIPYGAKIVKKNIDEFDELVDKFYNSKFNSSNSLYVICRSFPCHNFPNPMQFVIIFPLQNFATYSILLGELPVLQYIAL